jgi:hypothetical protein
VSNIEAAVLPSSSPDPIEAMVKKLANMNGRDFESMLGHRLSFKERILFTAIRAKARHYEKKGITPAEMTVIREKLMNTGNKKDKQPDKKSSLGKTALIFGIAGAGLFVIGLFAAPLLIGSLVSSIVAIATGSAATKENSSDIRAHTGKLLGWITLLLLIALLILVIVAISTWFSWL